MKRLDRAEHILVRPVAPRAGAWIETNKECGNRDEEGSPPARGRGLKLLCTS